MEYPIQELNLTAGWTVQYHESYAVDPTSGLVADGDARLLFKEDMYQATHERHRRLLDLGWYPEGEWDAGSYGLVLYAGDYQGQLIREIRTKNRVDIVRTMNKWFHAVTRGEL